MFELFGKSFHPYLKTVSILVWKLYRQVQKPSGADKEAINQSQAAASLVNTQMVGNWYLYLSLYLYLYLVLER